MDIIFDSSLVLYLPLYEMDGASFKSRESFGHLCTVNGALWRPKGRGFDKSDDVVSAGAIPAFNVGTGDLSFLVWFNADNVTDTQAIFRNRTGENAYAWGSYIGGGAVYAHWRNGAGSIKAQSVPIVVNTWYCLAGVRQSGNVYGYLNSVSMGAAVSGADMNLAAHLEAPLGAHNTPYQGFFGGLIGEVVVYNRALTPAEIQRNYLATKWRYQ